jgi:hypothetical protein
LPASRPGALASRRFGGAARKGRTILEVRRAGSPVALTATPDRRRPSDGLVIEASILARLLRLRLLTLDATVVVVSAAVPALSSTPSDVRGRALARPVRSAGALPSGRSQPSGGRRGLAEAVRTIEEGAAILAAVRRDAAAGVSRRGGGTGQSAE